MSLPGGCFRAGRLTARPIGGTFSSRAEVPDVQATVRAGTSSPMLPSPAGTRGRQNTLRSTNSGGIMRACDTILLMPLNLVSLKSEDAKRGRQTECADSFNLILTASTILGKRACLKHGSRRKVSTSPQRMHGLIHQPEN